MAGCEVSLRHKISIARMTKFSIFLKNLHCDSARLPLCQTGDSLKCDIYLGENENKVEYTNFFISKDRKSIVCIFTLAALLITLQETKRSLATTSHANTIIYSSSGLLFH